MKIGAVYPQTELNGDPEAVRQFGCAVESLGFDHLLAYDHVVGATHDREPKLNGPYTDHHPFHDPLVMFSHLAAITKRLEFVTGVLILPQRQTVLAAKQIADLDLLSGQRVRIAVGIGWNYVEYDALGQNFRTRGRRVEEQVGFMRRLWSEPLVTFKGEFDQIDRGCIIPRPKRMIPLWMGGHAEAALERATRLAEGFLFSAGFDESMKELEIINRHLQKNQRAEPFGKELIVRLADGSRAAADQVHKWRDAGGTHVAIATMGRGFSGVQAHIDHVAEVKQLIKL